MLLTNKQTDKQTVSNDLPTPTDIVGVDNKIFNVRLKTDRKPVYSTARIDLKEKKRKLKRKNFDPESLNTQESR